MELLFSKSCGMNSLVQEGLATCIGMILIVDLKDEKTYTEIEVNLCRGG